MRTKIIRPGEVRMRWLSALACSGLLATALPLMPADDDHRGSGHVGSYTHHYNSHYYGSHYGGGYSSGGHIGGRYSGHDVYTPGYRGRSYDGHRSYRRGGGHRSLWFNLFGH